MKKLLTVNNIARALVIVLALIAGIIYLVTATSGYLAGIPYDATVFVFALLAILFVVCSALLSVKLPKIGPFLLLVSGLFLSLALVNGILDRAKFIGDSFIPMDYPAQFYSALSGTYASLVMLGVGVIVLAISCFIPEIRLGKDVVE